MRALIQRVSRAQVSEKQASNKKIASIPTGLLVFVAFEESDTPVSIEQMAQKMKSLRVFSDEKGKLNISGPEASAEYLLVSQFTLYADCKYGNRPSFDKAASKPRAKEYYEHFVKTFERMMGTDKVRHAPFGTDLNVELTNDGPVTLFLNSHEVL